MVLLIKSRGKVNKVKPPLKRMVLFLFILILLTLIARMVYMCTVVYTETIYSGIVVDGFDVGGMTTEEAFQILSESTDRTFHKKAILLFSPFGQYRLPLDNIEYMPDYAGALESAFLQGRSGNLFKRFRVIQRIGKLGLHIEPKICYNKEKTGIILDSIGLDMEIKPVNAVIKLQNGKMEITEHKNGAALDLETSMERIDASLSGRTFDDIELCVVDIAPDITTQMVDRITFRMGEYKTVFNTNNEERAHNIGTACGRINLKLLLPGEIFSMDRILGERTEENGYREAKIIVNNELVDGLGGGICQVTSTMYNSVLLSGLEIVERRNHSIPLSYIDIGRDATISQGYIDFKFKNNSGYAVLIEAKTVDNQVYIAIWGRARENKTTFRIRTNVIEEILPEGIETEFDDSLQPNVVEIIREAKPGYRVDVYRDTLDTSGKVVNTEKISTDRYQPQKKKIRVAPTAANIVNETDTGDSP